MKRGWRPTQAVAAVLALAVCGSLATPALADKSHFHVRASIKMKRTVGQDKFSGKLRSKERACAANRRVKLHHRNVTQQAKSGVIAKVRTNSKGKWTYLAKKNQNGDRYATPGNYTLKIGQKRISTGDGGGICRSKNTSSVFVG